MIRFAQISDTHLSAVHGFFYDNFRQAVAHLNGQRLDFLVNTGDISIDGADRRDDLVFARKCHDAFAGECLFIPGNHDLGNEPYKEDVAQVVDPARLARYRDVFGHDWWRKDVPHWTLIGLNSALFGSPLPQADEQWRWLRDNLDGANANIGIFVHKPLFLSRERETSPGVSLIGHAAQQLLSELDKRPVRFVSCGHLHQHAGFMVGEIAHYWAPSTAFLLSRQIGHGRAELGYFQFELSADEHKVNFVHLPQLTPFNVEEVRGSASELRLLPPAPVSL